MAGDISNIDPNKVVQAVIAKMAARIDYAKSPAAGFGTGANALAIYEFSAFKTPEAFCQAESSEYRLCQELLAAGQA